MKPIYLLLLLSSQLLPSAPRAASVRDSLLRALDNAIVASPAYDSGKLKMIAALRGRLSRAGAQDFRARYSICSKLYDAFRSFNYDSAYAYAAKLGQLAYALGDPSLIAEARIDMGFILVSSGLFRETSDSLGSFDVSDLPDSIRAEFYSLMGRYYYDMGDFDNDRYYTPAYDLRGDAYMDSALRLYPRGSFSYCYFLGLKDIKQGRMAEASRNFHEVINWPNLDPHDHAILASTLSDIYIRADEPDTAIDLLIRAAIDDIKSSTKETSAILNLAELLYRKGDVRDASRYIERALEDAEFYGARQRKIQVSSIMPIIEQEKIAAVEGQRKVLIEYASLVTLLLLALVALSFVIFRQVRKLRQAQAALSDAHDHTKEINRQLVEANKIKEEYIGYFFNVNSDYVAKLEKFKKSIEHKLGERKYDDIRFLAGNINLKREKDDLLQHFDKVFLKLFPHFVDDYNSLFRPEDQVHLKDEELLNTDLRIFALIRMGISDNEKIAKILEYSVNTIYTYKTRIKNKSIVDNDAFEDRIMQIRAL